VAVTAGNLAQLLLSLGRIEESRAAFLDGLAWARRTGQQRGERICLVNLARLVHHAGRPDEALELLDTAERLGGDEFTGALLLLTRGRLALRARPGQAIEDGERALAYADTTENNELRLDAYALLARARAARGDRAGARAACDAFLERWHAAGGMQLTADPLVETGLVLAADRRHADLAGAIALLTTPSPWADAARALADRREQEAAAILDSIPSIPLRDAAHELIRTAESTPAAGEPQT
jgi:tetratricopeptide (TPR) repeat protein